MSQMDTAPAIFKIKTVYRTHTMFAMFCEFSADFGIMRNLYWWVAVRPHELNEQYADIAIN
jgi:hypothetical protein